MADLTLEEDERRKRYLAATSSPEAAGASFAATVPQVAQTLQPPPPALPSTPEPAQQLPDIQLIPPPDAAPSAPTPALAPAPNLDSTHTTGTTTKTVLSPEYKSNLTNQKITDAIETGNLQAKGDLDRDIAVKRQQQADEEVKFAAAKSRAIAEAQSWGDTEVKNATAKFTEAQDKYRGRKIEDYWADKTTGTKVLAAISVALGTLGAGLSGGRTSNDALKIMESAINLDYQRQKANIEKEGQDLQMLRAGIGDARLAKADKLNDLNGRTAAAWGEVEAKFRASLAAKGVDAATIDNDARVVAARDHQLAVERQALEPTMKRVSTTIETVKNDPRLVAAAAKAPKDPTADQSKRAELLTPLVKDHQLIESLPQLSAKGRQLIREETAMQIYADKNPQLDLAAKVLGVRKTVQERLPDADRRSYAAYKRWLDPVVRSRTGANAPLQEVSGYIDTLVPGVGDKPADVADKRNARIEIMRGIAEGTHDPAKYRGLIDGTTPAGGGAAPQKLSQGEAVQLVEFVRKNPSMPAAQQARSLLESQGWIKPRAN